MSAQQTNAVTVEENEYHENKLDKRTVRIAMWRAILTFEWSWNYERMQGLGFLFGMMPVLKKLYKKGDDLKAAMRRHLQFYNTNVVTSPIILGATIAMEEKGLGKATESLKIGLMGPLAGIGDTLVAIIFKPMVAVIAASLAMNGHVAGAIIMFLCGIFLTILKVFIFDLGYKQGVNVLSKITGENIIEKITSTASIIGLIVVGGFAPSILSSVVTPIQFAKTAVINGKAVEKVIKLQDNLDTILPCMLPIIFIGFCYYLFKKKKLPIPLILFIVLAIGFVCGALGILKTS